MRSTIRWNVGPHQTANVSFQTGQSYNDVMPVHSAFLKYFHEVCKTESIRKAARNLYVASSAINRQILKMESELGVKLFERSLAGATLTPARAILTPGHPRGGLEQVSLAEYAEFPYFLLHAGLNGV